MGRILGLDHGTKRIGLAVSDALGLAAHGLPTLSRAGMEVDLAAIAALVAEREIDEVVVGLPRNMDGSEGLQAKQARAFAARLREALGLPVSFEDERLTSERAQRALAEGGLTRGKRKQRVDRLAAQFILQQFLERRRKQRQGEGP